jgi:eukaryotic-like serine/threonine-protein kinase
MAAVLGRSIGRYRILGPLGHGGMGTVWRAEDAFLRRNVALKLLPEGTAQSPQARRRFIREARSASALDHSGIATLFDAGEDSDHIYLAFALIEGRTLREILTSGPLPLVDVARIGAEAAEALAHAHARGIIHRDISAGNVMVATDGRVVLIDFGLALAADAVRITSSGQTVGTVPYLAPEVALGEGADHRSDIYSLGVVLYEMATGCLPFRGERAAAVLYNIVHEPPPPMREHRPDVDPRLETAIEHALAKDPACRPQRIEELAEALRAIAGPGAPADDRPPAVRPRSRGGLALRTTVAVMPFEAIETDPEKSAGIEALGRGVAEMLSASLARVPQIQVIAPGETLAFEKHTHLREVARGLGAHLLLLGNVRCSRDQIRISFTLVDGSGGGQLAGELINGTRGDLFALEDRLVASVIRALRIEVSGDDLRAPGMTEAATHEQYVRALGYLQRTDQEASIDAGIELLEQIVDVEGPSTLVQAALARGYLRKLELTREVDWRLKAEHACRLALGLDPHSPRVLVTLGRLMMRSGRHDEAVSTLRRAIDLDPSDPDAWSTLCQAYSDAGNLEEARLAGMEAVGLRPSDWMAHDRLALVSFLMGRFRDAAESWRRAAAITPHNTLVLTNLAAACFHLGWFAEARRHFSRSLEVAPTASAYLGVGTLAFFDGDRELAARMFERAVELRPNDYRAWGNLADARRWIPGATSASDLAFDRAIDLVRRHLAETPHDGEAWSYRAKWEAKRGQLAEARESITRALEIAPKNITVHGRAITVFHLSKDRERAVAELIHAVDGGYSRMELERDPELEQLHEDPRVKSALQRRDGITEPLQRGGESHGETQGNGDVERSSSHDQPRAASSQEEHSG